MSFVGVKKGAGGQDGFQNGVHEVAKTPQDGAKMRPRHEKMSPRNVATAGRFAVFAKHVGGVATGKMWVSDGGNCARRTRKNRLARPNKRRLGAKMQGMWYQGHGDLDCRLLRKGGSRAPIL